MFQPSGSFGLASSPVVKVPPNVEVTIAPTKSDIQKIADNPYINDAMGHKTTYNPITSWTAISSLHAFPASTATIVTFYTKNTGEINTRTVDSDFALALGLEQNFLKILNFELRLSPNGISHSFDPDTNISSATGSAFIYPRFAVSVGDVFLYSLDQGGLGLFKVNGITPLSIHKDCMHEVTFELIRFPTIEELRELDSYVDRTAYFFKDKFFNGDVGLIYDETYQLLSFIDQKKNLLLTYYTETFYDKTLHTFVRPDGIYDPYLVEFLSSFVNFYQLENFPKMLLTEYENKTKNIFTYILEFNKRIKSIIPNRFTVMTKNYSHRDTDINGLINRQYIVLTSETVDTFEYILPKFMTDDIDTGNLLEQILLKYVNQKTIEPAILTTEIDGFLTLQPNDQFYSIPIYLYLLAVLEGILLR